MKRYIQKRTIVHAAQFNKHNKLDIRKWMVSCGVKGVYENMGCLVFPTFEGQMLARPGDWIVEGIRGEFYSVKNEIFLERYEECKD